MNGGVKHDSDKIRLELISPVALELLGKVLTFGVRKYEAWNWAKGMLWSRVYGATLRHLNAWWAGESLDAETGLSHLAHAFCELMFLITYEALGLGTDDRWRPSKGG